MLVEFTCEDFLSWTLIYWGFGDYWFNIIVSEWSVHYVLISSLISLLNHWLFTRILFCLHLLLFSCSVVSDSLWPHGLQHTRPPCPSLSPRACPNSCPSSRWCHPAIASSVVPFSSCPQSCPASGSFPRSQLFTSGGQSTGASALVSVLPVNLQGWFLLGWTGLISLQSKGFSRVLASMYLCFSQLSSYNWFLLSYYCGWKKCLIWLFS